MEDVKHLIGIKGVSGFSDGCSSVATLSSPVGLAARGSTLYIAEYPDMVDGAIRVCSGLAGVVNFKTIWRDITSCFGMMSKRERSYYLKRENCRGDILKVLKFLYSKNKQAESGTAQQ